MRRVYFIAHEHSRHTQDATPRWDSGPLLPLGCRECQSVRPHHRQTVHRQTGNRSGGRSLTADMTGDSPLSYESVIRRYTLTELTAWVDMPMPERYGCIDIDERRVIPDIEIRYAVIKACGLRSISDFQLLTLERRKSVIQEVMRSLDVRPRQLSRVTGMNYETIRNIAKKLP